MSRVPFGWIRFLQKRKPHDRKKGTRPPKAEEPDEHLNLLQLNSQQHSQWSWWDSSGSGLQVNTTLYMRTVSMAKCAWQCQDCQWEILKLTTASITTVLWRHRSLCQYSCLLELKLYSVTALGRHISGRKHSGILCIGSYAWSESIQIVCRLHQTT